ncbi:MAG: hypothetical protein LKF69_00705 [Bacilli bacterium]|nr:hypothetical protein [Bacilli bacterium]
MKTSKAWLILLSRQGLPIRFALASCPLTAYTFPLVSFLLSSFITRASPSATAVNACVFV